MPVVEGQTLGEVLKSSGPMSPRQAAELVRTLARALQEAHDRGVIHRDLKPSNVMIDHRGTPRVMDFGLARKLDTGDERLTQPGMIVGTCAYMAPEQVMCDEAAIGPRSDVYGLGVILYELLAGRRPFAHALYYELCKQIVNERPEPPSTLRAGLDPGLEAVCLKALEKKPADRFDSMAAFAEALDRWLVRPEKPANETPRPDSPWPSWVPHSWRPWVPLIALAIALPPLLFPAIVAFVEVGPAAASRSSPEEGTRAGQGRDDNALKMVFCWCPAGSFRMGSPPNEPGRKNEENQVDVTLSRGFWMGKCEVTQEQWRRVMGTHLRDKAGGLTLSGESTLHPMYYLSHTDAEAFCRKLTETERAAGRLPAGWGYRLPTEAQWDYACRAWTTTATAFGDRLSSEQANLDGKYPYNGAAKGPYLQATCPGWALQAEPLGPVRHARERLGVVPRRVRRGAPGGARSFRARRSSASGDPGRELVQLRRGLPVGHPRQARARVPGLLPGVPRGPSFVR
jgi:formylglycine-generating enzyme required for sulfatase activity